MNKISLVLPLFFLAALPARSQTSYTPEKVFGHRAMSYQHIVTHAFAEGKMHLANVVLYDTEYGSKRNNIYFIRNTFSYAVKKNWSLVAGLGMKNPGSFGMLALQFQYKQQSFSLSYTGGATYQRGFTLEQSFIVEYLPEIKEKLRMVIRAQIAANINNTYDRGFQQIRAGLKTEGLQFGLAANLDQWHNSTKTLQNYGLFIKTTIK